MENKVDTNFSITVELATPSPPPENLENLDVPSEGNEKPRVKIKRSSVVYRRPARVSMVSNCDEDDDDVLLINKEADEVINIDLC